MTKKLFCLILSVLMMMSITAGIDFSAMAAGSSFATATTVGFDTKITGQLTERHKDDYYRVELPSAGRLTVSASVFSEYAYFYLYNSEQREIVYKYVYEDERENITYDLTKGTYYLLANGEMLWGDDVSDYQLIFTFTSANESFTETGYGTNNTFATASTINVNTTYVGQLAYNDEVDCYKFTLPSSGKLTLDLKSKIDYYIPVELYNDEKELLWEDSCFNDDEYHGELVKASDLTKGTYYLAVKRNFSDATGVYGFILNFTSANESFEETGYGSNNSFDTANSISTDTLYTGQLALGDIVDYYKFTLESSGKIALEVKSKVSSWVDVVIYNSDRVKLWDDSCYISDGAAQGELNKTIHLTKGTYYIAFKNDGLHNTGIYGFRLNFTSANESFEESGYGTNNSMSTANTITFGKAYNGQIALNDSVDYYCLTLSKKGKIRVNLTGKIDFITVTVYDAGGYKVWETVDTSDSFGQINLDESTIDPLSAGKYYISVGNTYGDTGTYTLSINCGHDYKAVDTKKATCTANGVRTYTCSICGNKYTTVIKATGHKTKTVTTNATYAKAGKVETKCTACGKVFSTKTIAKLTVPKITLSSVKSSKSKQITVTWKKNTKVTGYEIQYSTDKNFKKGNKTVKVTKNGTTSTTIKKLTGKKKYYVRVRAYKTYNKKNYFSAWSAVKNVTTKK